MARRGRTGRRRRPKKLPVGAHLGQRGIHLIEGVVLKMGSRWTPSGPNEVGIDGYIELFDPSTRESTGKTLAVQSKAVTQFANESPDYFDYWCDRVDIEYWLGGNTPVLLIVSRPDSGEAYWISVKDYFGRPQYDGSTRVRFSKTDDRFTPDAFPRMLNLGESRQVGLYLAPPPKAERLHSNLLQLKSVPDKIYTARTECRTARDVWSILAGAAPSVNGAWLLREKMILGFHDLGEDPWPKICDAGTVEGIETSYWSDSDDPDRLRQFVQLLNQTLRSQVFGLVHYWPQEDCYAFTASMERPVRKWTYRSAKQQSTITVVSKYETTIGERRFQWLRHLAFRGQFRRLEGQWYLEITPTYRFTTNGQALDRFHSERLSGIKRIEGNRAVLSAVLLWADFLRRPGDLFESRPQVLQFGDLFQTELEVGISDDAWLASDTGGQVSEPSLAELLYLPFPEEGIE